MIGRPFAGVTVTGLALAAVFMVGCGGGAAPAGASAPAGRGAAGGTPTTLASGGQGSGGQGSAGAPASAGNALVVRSDAFADGGVIPNRYTCTGAGQPPDLSWSGNTRSAAALAVVVDDPDAPSGDFVHWVVLDLPRQATGLSRSALPQGAHQANNSGRRLGWTPPCPPSGTHHYRFTVYLLRAATGLPNGVDAATAVRAVEAGSIGYGRLVGTVTHS